MYSKNNYVIKKNSFGISNSEEMSKNAISGSDTDQDVVVLMEIRYSSKMPVVKDQQGNSKSINTWIQNPVLKTSCSSLESSSRTYLNPVPNVWQKNPGPSTTLIQNIKSIGTYVNPVQNECQQNPAPSTTWTNNSASTVWQQNPEPSSTACQKNPGSSTLYMRNPGPSTLYMQNPEPSSAAWVQNPGTAECQKNPGPSTLYMQNPDTSFYQQSTGVVNLRPHSDRNITLQNELRENSLFTRQQRYQNNGMNVLENKSESNNDMDVVKIQHKRKAGGYLQNSNKKSREEKLMNLNNNDKSDYEKLLELENSIVVNSEASQCLRCFNNVTSGNGVVLHECLHSFCRPCLIYEIENSLAPIIKCPSRNQNFTCDAHLQEMEIKLLVPADLYERHLQLSATIAEVSAKNSYHCNTTGCKGWCFYEKGVKNFSCQICGHVNCLECFSMHEGKSCEQHQRDSEEMNINNEVRIQDVVKFPIKFFDRDIFFCQFPDCTGCCFTYEDETVFFCNVCKLINCIPCEAIHEGLSCKEYQDGAQLQASALHLKSENDNVEKDYEKLVKLATELVPNSEPFICSICFEDIPTGEGITLHECLHNFCRECLISTVKHSETPVVVCPFMGENYTCESHLKEFEIKSLVSPELYEKHLRRSVTIAEGCAENSFHCKTADCPGWCLYEDDVQFFNCPVCNHQNCVNCDAIHKNLTCKEYQKNIERAAIDDDQQRKSEEHIKKLIKAGKAMPCPKCKIILKKELGCDGLTCPVCKTDVCWATKGPRWGPDGKGDMSGGCRCMVDGKRCHKKCTNCH